jgi:alkylation response protein AidB-like acyl-CoA dehydrogenase
VTAGFAGAVSETGEARDFLRELDRVVADVEAGAAHRDGAREYARIEIEQLRDTRFWSSTVPREFGGLGLGAEVVIQAVLALAAADGSLGQIPQNHLMTVERIRLATTDRQREHWLRRVGAGAVLGNANAEPSEPHPGEHGTRVSRGLEGLRLTGRKVCATGSLLADHIAVAARDDDGTPRTVLVDAAAPGVVVHDDWHGLGQRTTASGTAEFHDVAVDDLALLPLLDDPVATYRVSSLGQLIHAAIDTGIALGALDRAVELAARVHAGRGSGVREFGDDVLGVAQLGELRISALGARRLVESAAARLAGLDPDSRLDAVVDVFYEVAAAKVVSTRAALAVTTQLFDIGGTSSTYPALGLDRYWRDARTHTLHDAVRWKPYAIGHWILTGDVADPWSIGHPFVPSTQLRNIIRPADKDLP